MKNEDFKIKKTDLIGEIVEKYPIIGEVLVVDFGLRCVGCGAAMEETIEQGAMIHGMSEKEVDKMIEKLNKVVKKLI